MLQRYGNRRHGPNDSVGVAANRRIALLIATDTYDDDEFVDLRTPCTDATALADLLAHPQIGAFEVTTLVNRPAQEIRQALDETFTDASRNDLVLLHVSGHGIKDEGGKLHLVMSDTRRRHLRASAIAAGWVRELIDHSAARRVVVWLDCCYSGAFPPGFTPKGTETVDAIDQLAGDSAGRGCAVMTASTKIQHAFERDEMSLFTQAIVEGLRTGEADLNEDGRIDAGELYTFVYDWVRGRTPDQTPTRNDMLTGDIYVAHSGRGARLPLNLPPEIRQLLRSQDERYRLMGLKELKNLAASGDDVAWAALSALADEPPASNRVRLVIDAGPHPLPRFEHAHSFRAMNRRGLVEHHSTAVTCMAFNPSRPGLVCVGTTNTVEFINAYKPAARCRTIHMVRHDRVRALAFSPNGRWLLTATEHEMCAWHPDDQTAPIWKKRGALATAFSQDGKTLASARGSNITLWGTSTPRPLGDPLTGHKYSVTGLAFNPDGNLLASASFDGTIRLWHPRTRSPVGVPLTDHEGSGQSVAFSPDGRLLATTARDTVRLWDPLSGLQFGASMEHNGSVLAIAFSLDGHALISATLDGEVRVWDPYAGKLIQTLEGHKMPVVAVDFSPDGQHLGSVDAGGEFILWERTR
ncbi:caspase, EACC1-associated type [Lentzea sp. NPDC004789]